MDCNNGTMNYFQGQVIAYKHNSKVSTLHTTEMNCVFNGYLQQTYIAGFVILLLFAYFSRKHSHLCQTSWQGKVKDKVEL